MSKKYLSTESLIFIIAITLVLAPLILFYQLSSYYFTQYLVDNIATELTSKSALVAYDIDNFIHERTIDAKILSQADILEGNDEKAIKQYFNEIVDANKWIDEIDLVSLSGIIINSSTASSPNQQGKTIWDVYDINKSLFQSVRHAKQGDVYLSHPLITDGAPSILLLTPVTDDTNTVLTEVLSIKINLKHIKKAISLFNDSVVGDKYVYIVDNDGKVIVTDDPTVSFFDTFPDLNKNPVLLQAFSRQGNIGHTTYVDNEDDVVMAAYSDMAEFGTNKALDWSIIAISPMNEILAPAYSVQKLLLVVGISVGLLTVFFVFILIFIFIKKLKMISDQADAIASGNYTNKALDALNRKGSLNTLIFAINKMQKNIHQFITELKDREQRLDLTLSSIGDGVIATDEKGNITRMNPASERLTGWTSNEAQNRPVTDVFKIIDETDRKTIENPIEKVINTGETVYLSNHTILLSKDGCEFQIEDSAAPIRDDAGTIYGMILIFSDVTRRKQAEQRYRQTLKMDALGKLTGGIAHDYNNILGVIMGYSELLNEKLNEQPILFKYSNTILNSAIRGSELTKKLLQFSKHKTAEVTPVNISRTLQDQQLMLEKTLTARINLLFDFAQDLWIIHIDENDFIDAVLNICINSMHAIKGNGRISIKTSNEILNHEDAKTLDIAPGEYVQLRIEDNGCGMDEKTKNKIFDPFFTTKGEKGTGLGLSQVYGFMRRSNGAIKVYSEPAHGTCLSLYFPRYYTSDIDVSHKQTDIDSMTGNGAILVVDDEKDLLDFCTTILQKHGFSVFSAESAKVALDILEKEKIDILLSDIIMPEMSGYQLAAIVVEKYPSIKIQLASGFSEGQEVDNISPDIKENLLLKPFSTQSLLQAINNMLNK